MACFLVPTAEAVVTTIIEKKVKAKELKKAHEEADNGQQLFAYEESHIPFSHKMKWLNSMLWGGSALLAFEHLWHGEITPFFPFLTAANNPEDTAAMLGEMGTVGVTMAVLVTLVWAGMVVVSSALEKKDVKETSAQKM